MMSTGEIVRQIRLAKGLRTKYIYNGLMTQPTSSEYERGKSEVKISKLIIIIERLNLEFSEFIFLFKRENDRFLLYKKYHQRLLRAFQNSNEVELRLIHQNIMNLAEFNKLTRFTNLGLVASCMIKKLASEKESFSFEKTSITEYLIGIKTWGKYEYQLLVETLFMYNENDLRQLLDQQRCKELCNNQNGASLGQAKVKLLAAIIIKLIKLNQYKEHKDLLAILNEIKIPNDDLYSKFYISFIIGLDLFESGNLAEGTKIISTTLDYCQEFKMNSLEQELVENLKSCLASKLLS